MSRHSRYIHVCHVCTMYTTSLCMGVALPTCARAERESCAGEGDETTRIHTVRPQCGSARPSHPPLSYTEEADRGSPPGQARQASARLSTYHGEPSHPSHFCICRPSSSSLCKAYYVHTYGRGAASHLITFSAHTHARRETEYISCSIPSSRAVRDVWGLHLSCVWEHFTRTACSRTSSIRLLLCHFG